MSSEQHWQWKGFSIAYSAKPAAIESNNAIILVHGFGACKEHWRVNIDALANVGHVYALDLIGFGQSAKPSSRLQGELQGDGENANFQYCIASWAQLTRDFIKQFADNKKITLIGNSIGGVVACETARLLETTSEAADKIILIDCAQREIDDKRLSEQPPFRKLSKPLLKKLVRQRWLTNALYRGLAKPGVIKRVLKIAYPTKRNVDQELIDVLYRATQDTNSPESFRGFINLFDDLLAPDILRQLKTPTYLIWGEKDPWEPVEEAKKWQSIDSVKSLQIFAGLGHCPHDESPETINPALISLIKS